MGGRVTTGSRAIPHEPHEATMPQDLQSPSQRPRSRTIFAPYPCAFIASHQHPFGTCAGSLRKLKITPPPSVFPRAVRSIPHGQPAARALSPRDPFPWSTVARPRGEESRQEASKPCRRRRDGFPRWVSIRERSSWRDAEQRSGLRLRKIKKQGRAVEVAEGGCLRVRLSLF